jgi:hypothetical protein
MSNGYVLLCPEIAHYCGGDKPRMASEVVNGHSVTSNTGA